MPTTSPNCLRRRIRQDLAAVTGLTLPYNPAPPMAKRTGQQELAGWLERGGKPTTSPNCTFAAGIRQDLAAVTSARSTPEWRLPYWRKGYKNVYVLTFA